MQFNCTPPLLDVIVAFKLEIISSISIKFDIIEMVQLRHLNVTKLKVYALIYAYDYDN